MGTMGLALTGDALFHLRKDTKRVSTPPGCMYTKICTEYIKAPPNSGWEFFIFFAFDPPIFSSSFSITINNFDHFVDITVDITT